MPISSRSLRLVLLLALSLTATGAAAIAQRTFVASYGVPANTATNCGLTTPCRAFSEAISVTNTGGEVIVLDSAGYGPVTISQPVSIIAPAGVYAGISVFAGSGITIAAGSGIVTLRGLTVNSLGGTIGIDYQSGARLYLDSVLVTGFASTPASAGIRAAMATSGNLSVLNSALRDNTTGLTASTTSGTVTVDVDASAFERNAIGIDLRDGTAGVIRNSTITDGGTGINAVPGTAARSSTIEVRRSLVADNTAVGVQSGANAAAPTFVSVISSLVTGNATGVQSTANPVYCSDNTIARNATGLSLVTGGTGQTAQDNSLTNNTGTAAFTSTVPKL